MEPRPPVFLFLLFLEEFILWQPGQASTIIERLTLLVINTLQGSMQQPIDYTLVTLMNPAVAIFLFVLSSGRTVRYIRSLLTNWTSTDLILFINRYSIIRIVITIVIGIWLIQQVLEVLSSGNLFGLLDLYQNKPFWTAVFIGAAALQFTSPSN